MALRKKLRKTPPRIERGYQPRLPHTSWKLAPAEAAGSVGAGVASASEFWSRLGL